MKHLNDIDKIFKDALDGRREVVPPNIWKAVDERINNKSNALKTSHNRFKSLIKLLIVLIFSSAIFFAYYSTKNGTSNTKRFAFSEASLHRDSARKGASFDEPTMQLSKNNMKLPIDVRDNAPLGYTQHYSTDTLFMAGFLNKSNEINLKSIHHRQEFLADTTMSTSLNTVSRSHDRSHEYRNTSLATKLNQSFQKVNNQSARILTNQMQTVSGKTAGPIGMINRDRWDRLLRGEPDSSEKANRAVVNFQGDVLSKANNLTSIATRTIQPWPLPYKFNGVQYAAINHFNLFSNNNLQKKQSVKLQSIHSVSIEPFGSANYSFRNIDEGKHQGSRGVNKSDVKKDESRGSSSSAGVFVNYGINKDLFIQSGLVFSSVETNIKAGMIYARGDNNGRTKYELISSSGYSYLSNRTGISLSPGDSIAINGSSSTIKYISLPLSINYAWHRGKFIFNPGVGLSMNVLTSGSSSISVGNLLNQYTEKTTITGLNHVYLDGMFGIGVEYKFTHKLSLEMRPLIRLGITPINDDTPLKTFQNYLNLETGLKIKL